MNVLRSLGNSLVYLSEAAARLFSYAQDDYPATGVQPFTGDPYSKWVAGASDRKVEQ